MGFDIGKKIGDEWADAKYTLSQRKAWEIVTALVLIVLLIGCVVMSFVFTIVKPPGELGASSSNSISSTSTRHHGHRASANQQQRVPALYKRSVDQIEGDLKENSESDLKLAGASGIDDALHCVEIGSEMIENGISSSEAAKEIILCLGKVSIPNMGMELEQELATALFTGNRDEAMEILIKIIQFDVIREPPKSA